MKASAQPKILIVDSDAGVSHYLRNTLARQYAVHLCSSGKEVVASLNEGLEPQLVLLDTT